MKVADLSCPCLAVSSKLQSDFHHMKAQLICYGKRYSVKSPVVGTAILRTMVPGHFWLRLGPV